IVISASRTGAGVLLAVEDAGWLQAGQQVELSFRHEAAGPVTRVQGTVVRIAPPEDPAKPVFQVGIDFTAEYAPDPGS
ncbi:MAG: PilZ domain-containing protein, partial [Candidatus Wallbacteria bacterium]|nr:PilZ domain-containing protein [Candidatus Wallbacteria bacterium]